MTPTMQTPVERVGVVGIGLMGLAMALRLRDAGHAVTVRDVDASREVLAAQAGAQIAATPAAVGSACELLIVAVVDAAQTRALLFGADGAADAMVAGSCVMLCPTIAPGDVESIAAELQTRGLRCIDAPMSGGPARARAGTMSLMVACDDAVFARWQGLLAQLGSRLFRIGTRVGDGARTKLVNNLLAAVNLAGAAEAMALAERLGLDPAQTLDVIEQSSGQSWIGVDRMRRAVRNSPELTAQLALLAKDSALAMQAAAAVGFDPVVGGSAAAAFAQACAEGRAADDDSSLWQRGRG